MRRTSRIPKCWTFSRAFVGASLCVVKRLVGIYNIGAKPRVVLHGRSLHLKTIPRKQSKATLVRPVITLSSGKS